MGSGLAFFAAPGLLGGMGLGLAGGLAKVCSSTFTSSRFPFFLPSLASLPLPSLISLFALACTHFNMSIQIDSLFTTSRSR